MLLACRKNALILLLRFAARTRAEELGIGLHDARVDDLFDRAVKVQPLDYSNLENTTLTKSAHLARPTYVAPVFTSVRPGELHRPDVVARGQNTHVAAALLAEKKPAAQSVDSLDMREDLAKAMKRPSFGGVKVGFQSVERSREELERSLEVQRALARTQINADGLVPSIDSLSNEDTTNVVEIQSESDLDEHTSGLAVLEVTSKACRACKAFGPKYKRLAAEFHGQVRFLKVVGNENAYTHRLVTERLQVKATPTFYFLRDGEVVSNLRGGNEEKLRSALHDCLRPASWNPFAVSES